MLFSYFYVIIKLCLKLLQTIVILDARYLRHYTILSFSADFTKEIYLSSNIINLSNCILLHEYQVIFVMR